MTRYEFSERRTEFDREHPYCAPYATQEAAQAWIDAHHAAVGSFYRKHYPKDVFRPYEMGGGWGVMQDVARG